jgi:fused signal recognition particle receptor
VNDTTTEKRGWLARLKAGLSRTSSRLGESITHALHARKLDDAALAEIEEALIAADLGPVAAARLADGLRRARFEGEVAEQKAREQLAADIAAILAPVALPLEIRRDAKPHVVLVVGVNGSGKTTTIGKLAKHWRDQGLEVTLAAGDTFRAAGVSQLQIWGERTGCPVIARPTGSDAAGLAFDALTQAKASGADVLVVDTAGRQQNRADLMSELQKIIRVLKKVDPAAPHSCLLVLDATTGQNAHSQVEIFRSMTDVTGLIVTKLDGTARGGVVVALAEKFGLPVHAIGVGEGADDLRPFEAGAFAKSLLGLSG